jgi:hypothetical protein
LGAEKVTHAGKREPERRDNTATSAAMSLGAERAAVTRAADLGGTTFETRVRRAIAIA